MSAAASAHLALMPPDPAQPPPELAAASVKTGAGVARARRVMLGIWITGCALLVLCTLLAPVTANLSLAGMVAAGLFLLPTSGLMLAVLALYERTRDAVLMLVAAALVFGPAILLLGPAHRAGVEIKVAANEPELDALAREVRAANAPVQPHASDDPVSVRFAPRLRRLGLRSALPVAGGVLFYSRGEMSYTLFYADAAAGPPDWCRRQRLRFLGGRWYEHDCLDRPIGDFTP